MCGCQSNNSVPVVNNISAKKVNTDCNVTEEQLNSIKSTLISKKNPENSGFINSQLGMIETMLNLGNYCLWDIQKIQFS